MFEFYKGKSVFVTGVTGFVGKAIVEKILRCLPDVAAVYILIRPTKSQSVEERLQKLYENPIFYRLKTENQSFQTKLVPIFGDISSENLGITEEDHRQLCENVSVVIHSAANVIFEAPLKSAFKVNVGGTENMLHFCAKLKSLEALVYVSTAYANCDIKDGSIKEEVYPAPDGALRLYKYIDTMSDDYVESSTKRYIGRKPNTYTYSKSCAEKVLETLATIHKIPCCIVRPSIVTSAYKEPLEGWTDSRHGANGITLSVMSGVLKTLYCDTTIDFDIIPVDIVANVVIAAAWETALYSSCARVYHCCSGPWNPFKLGAFINLILHESRSICPLSKCVAYPSVKLTKNRTWHSVTTYFCQYLPAYWIDVWINVMAIFDRISCQKFDDKPKPQKSVLHMANKIINSVKVVEYFTSNEWKFEAGNVEALEKSLYSNLPQSRHKEWILTSKTIIWKDYINKYCLGLRRYLVKEDDTTISNAVKRMKRLYFVKVICNAFAAILLLVSIITLLISIYIFVINSK